LVDIQAEEIKTSLLGGDQKTNWPCSEQGKPLNDSVNHSSFSVSHSRKQCIELRPIGLPLWKNMSSLCRGQANHRIPRYTTNLMYISNTPDSTFFTTQAIIFWGKTKWARR
jgi:hypothetical protein